MVGSEDLDVIRVIQGRLGSECTPPQRERNRIARLLIKHVTLNTPTKSTSTSTYAAGKTTSLAIPRPPQGFKARQTSRDALAFLDRLLDDHADAETAELLNHGHRSGTGQPSTTEIVIDLRHAYDIPSHGDRLRACGLLTRTELAVRLGVHPVTIRNRERAGVLTYHNINDRDHRLYEPPKPGDRTLVKHHGRRRKQPQPTTTNPRRCSMKPSSW